MIYRELVRIEVKNKTDNVWSEPYNLGSQISINKLDTITNGFPNIYWVDAKVI